MFTVHKAIILVSNKLNLSSITRLQATKTRNFTSAFVQSRKHPVKVQRETLEISNISCLSNTCSRNSKKDSPLDTNDPEMQELVKEMYKDFGIQNKEEIGGHSNLSEASLKEDPKQSLDKIETEVNSSENLHFSTDIIYDYDEERILREKGLWEEKVKRRVQVPEVIYERGKSGVFDVAELVDFLREKKAMDVVAINIPPEDKFVDCLVIATAKSKKHCDVLAEYINKIYKKKKSKNDRYTKVEGKGSNWQALDMGNIALHLMTEAVREEKDLETLWTVGLEYDEQCIEWRNPFATHQHTTTKEEYLV